MPKFENREQYEAWKQGRMASGAVHTEAPRERPGDASWAMLCHLSALGGFIVPFGHILFPWLVLVLKRDASPFVRDHGREAIAFQVRITVLSIMLVLLSFLLTIFSPQVGALVLLVLLLMPVLSVVAAIVAAAYANSGERYRYPLVKR